MLELYHNAMSTCSQKVRLTLAEKGLEWTGHHLNLRARDQHRPDYLALNPNGVVPTLVHDGAVIIESAVIDEYLDQLFPEPALRPKDPHERARMRIWVKQLDEGLHAASATISACIAFRSQFMAGKTQAEIEETLAGYIDPVKRARMRENVLEGVASSHFVTAIHRIRRMLDEMERDLEQGMWLAGQTYSLADIAFTPYVTRIHHLNQDWLLEARPHLAGWFDRIRARPAYQTAMVDLFNHDFVSLMAEKGDEERDAVRKILDA